MEQQGVRRSFEAVLGLVLILLGGLFLALQWVRVDVLDVAWPLFVIVPGLLLFALMGWFGPNSGFLAIPAAIITASGMILLVTNLFDAWETWAYAWTLVTPTAVGIGLLVWGGYAHNPELVRAGRIVTIVGLALFLAFGTLFELILGVGVLAQFDLGRIVIPVLLILFGVWLMGSSVLRRR